MPFAGKHGALLSLAVIIALGAYPLLVYATIGRFGPRALAGVLAAVCVARLLVVARRGGSRSPLHGLTLACVGGIALAGVGAWLDSETAVLFYPVLVNGVLLAVFGASLWHPPTAIERIARIREPELPPFAVAYTRRVTIAWTVFFALNGAIALYTAVATPLETWAFYNGLIAYLLIGALFAVELAVRTFVRARLRP